jgi:acetyl esterase/lipase
MRRLAQTLLLTWFAATAPAAPEVIALPFNPEAQAPTTSYPEKQYFSKLWNTQVVSNVTKPSLTVYGPLPWNRNGAGIVICPGGGFMALSIDSEGIDVAKWLAERDSLPSFSSTAWRRRKAMRRRSSVTFGKTGRNLPGCWPRSSRARLPTD